jgi:hypothetical protein
MIIMLGVCAGVLLALKLAGIGTVTYATVGVVLLMAILAEVIVHLNK